MRDGAFVVGPFTDEGSERQPGAEAVTTARQVPDGFVLDGLKHFATGFDAAHAPGVATAGLDDAHLRRRSNLAAFFVEEKPAEGIEVVASDGAASRCR
ncbi:hypothetical protein [Streptomyces sp. KL116D]|uniref:hypothetical protein n=1 Tax=Streptomyces sp. KL116D TaxID=3045152 RepID=UPI0035583515